MTSTDGNMNAAWLLGLATLTLAAGCGATAGQLRARAAFDLHCSKDALEVVEIDHHTRGVRGCGQQATYVEACDHPGAIQANNCTWVLNGDAREVRAP